MLYTIETKSDKHVSLFRDGVEIATPTKPRASPLSSVVFSCHSLVFVEDEFKMKLRGNVFIFYKRKIKIK